MFLGTMGGRHVIWVSKDMYIVTGASWSTTVHYQDAQLQCDLKSTLIDQGSIVRECLSGTLNGVQIEREFLHSVRDTTERKIREIESTPNDPETFRGRIEALLQHLKQPSIPKLRSRKRQLGSSTTAKQVG